MHFLKKSYMKNTFLLSCLLLLNQTLQAQQVIQLYTGKAPGSESWNWSEALNTNNAFETDALYNVSQPTLTAYLPTRETATGTAIIVAPGGGFHLLDVKYEGEAVAKWLQSKGIAAFLLKYRVAHTLGDDPVKEIFSKAPEKSDADMRAAVPLAMQDGLKALQYVRENAATFDIDPQRIGFIGFSAGGTVTMSVVYNATAANRPNFVAPIYAANSLVLGDKVPETPTPMFIAVAADDELNLMPQSLEIFQKWQAAKQPVELHVFEKGGHGFGMRKRGTPSDKWIERFSEWLKSHGYLKKRYPADWEINYTEEQLEEFRRAAELREKNDWANRARYAEDNKKLPAPKPGETRVVFLGNSIVEGWVREQPDFFSKNNFVGRGISGQTSPQTLLRYRQDVLNLKPKVVVINIGTNDIAENTGPYDPDFTMGNIISLCELAKANDVRVVLCSVLPATEFYWRKSVGGAADKILALNAQIKAYADQHKIVYCDYHSALKNAQNGMSADMAEDGVHPSLKAYDIMGELAKAAIKKALR